MRNKSKVFVMAGGIGNQLFIIAAGTYYSHRNNENIVFDFSRHAYGMTNHGSDVRSLNVDASFRDQRYMYIIKTGLNRLFKCKFLEEYTSPSIGYDSALENYIAEKQVFGYFQTFKYLQDPEVRDLMDSLHLDSTSDWFDACSAEMRNLPTISVHIRRGDYMSLKNSFGVLSRDYYEAAIKFTVENSATKYARVLIFSDDIALAQQLSCSLETSLPIQFAEPQEGSPEESLMLMSQSNALVMSNSSFSWWAAQLGNKSKFVVCPSKWFRDMLDPEGLIPPEWHREESRWES